VIIAFKMYVLTQTTQMSLNRYNIQIKYIVKILDTIPRTTLATEQV